MPQFEFETPDGTRRLLRARDPEDAARRAGVESPHLGAEVDVAGWREVLTGEETAGRVREHQRMRFRRD